MLIEKTYGITHRLEEVIFLIQHLGLDQYSLRNDTIPNEVKVRSAKSWLELAYQHPEFFRVTHPQESIILAWRYYTRDSSRGNHDPGPIDPKHVQHLADNAIALQERHAARSDALKLWGTLIASLAAAAFSLFQFFWSK